MKGIKLLLIVLTLAVSKGYSQDVFDKMSSKICKCIEKNNVQNADGITTCMEDAMFANMDEIRKAYFVETTGEIDSEDLGGKVAIRLMKNCSYFAEMIKDEVKNEPNELHHDSLMTITTDDKLSCTDTHLGDYYYLHDYSMPEDTTFVSFTNSTYLERMGGGKYYSRLDLKWLSKCKMKITFVESNHPFKASLSKEGDSYIYEVVNITDESILLETTWDNKQTYRMEFFKVK